MHYYIDGYNLMFRMVRAGGDLQSQRTHIIEELNTKISALELEATLVFDAHYQAGEGSRSHMKALEIRFTNKGETADQFIINELRTCKDPRKHTVVTSDKRLALHVRSKLAKTETVEEFMQMLNKRYRNKLKSEHPKLHKEPELTVPPPKKTEPSVGATAEECLDYYLKEFEKRAQDEAPVKMPKPPKRKPKNQKPPPEKSSGEDDMTRWLRLFGGF